MPFTLAHPAYAVPLRRLGLPVSALAAGAMVPDLPLYLHAIVRRDLVSYDLAHSTLGVLSVNLLAGLAIWACWTFVMRAPFFDALPGDLRRRTARFAMQTRHTPRHLLLVPMAVLVGAASHVLLDEFTHVGRWAHQHIDWFAQLHFGITGARWAQYVGGVLGLLALVTILLIHLRRLPSPTMDPRPAQPALWVLLAPAGSAIAATIWSVHALAVGHSLKHVSYRVATTGVLVVMATFLACCAIWHLLPRVRMTRHHRLT